MTLSIPELQRGLKILHVDFPSNPAGSMTGAQIITAINDTLGYTYWVNGISAAVFVNDFSAASADLAAYVGIDGKWHLPDQTVMVVNTEFQSVASSLGREIVADGTLYIAPSVGGGIKGITLVDGYGSGSYGITATSGYLIIGDVFCVSTDALRPFFNTSGLGLFSYHATACGLLIPGTLDATEVDIEVQQFLVTGTHAVVGAACSHFNFAAANTSAGFLSSSCGFDFSTPPTTGPRIISVGGTFIDGNAADGWFRIASDNGDNVGSFTNSTFDPSHGGKFIGATGDAVFNANPLFSVNFTFEVRNFGHTQRVGELYYQGSQAVGITTQNVWTDVTAVPFGAGDLCNAFTQSANGELEYTGTDPAIVHVSMNIGGVAASEHNPYRVGAFYKPAAGSYAIVTKGGYSVVDIFEPQNTVPDCHFNLEYCLTMNTGDKFKFMIENTGGTQDFIMNNATIIARFAP